MLAGITGKKTSRRKDLEETALISLAYLGEKLDTPILTQKIFR